MDSTTGSRLLSTRPWLSVARGQTGVTQPKEAEKLTIILHGREVTLPTQHSTPLSRCIVIGRGQGSHQAAGCLSGKLSYEVKILPLPNENNA